VSILDRFKMILVGAIIGVLLCSGVAVLIKYRPSAPAVATPQAPELAKETPKVLECEKVVIYRDAVTKKLGIEAKRGEHVVASSKLPGDSHPHTVSALYSEETGVTRLLDRQDPLPWLAFNRHGAMGVAYGVKDEASGFVTRLYGRLDLMQIKMLHAGLLGDVDNAGGWYGGAFAEMRW
jgi:hypothetical protein